jgi:hypothetical protein
MGCSSALSINHNEGGDTPLTQAIYSAAQDCIYGVNGQWVYKFNATTGAKEAEFRFVDDVMFSESYIVEIPGNSSLYIGTWRAGVEVVGSAIAGSDIFAVNYALNTSVALGLNGVGPFTAVSSTTFGLNGFTNLVTDGTLIYGFYGPRAALVFSVDPTNIAGTADTDSFGVAQGSGINDIAIDTNNSVLWMTGTTDQQLWCKAADLTSVQEAHSDPTPIDTMLGVCVIPNGTPANVKVYCVTGSDLVIKATVSDAYSGLPFLNNFAFTNLTILAADSKPMRIRYNSYDGFVYIPTWSNDTVEKLNPATDTISQIYTGFTNPVDIVCTPTKIWAVQWSEVGLREVA